MTNSTGSKASESNAKPGVEEKEKYTLRTSREVIQLLKALTKKPDLITARIPAGGQSVMTAVLDVLPKKNLVVLDYGPVEALNKKLLNAERIVFSTRHDLVETRFSCEALTRVKYKGEPAFAAPIPTSVLHLQRREYFRIKPLISHPVYCGLNRKGESPLKLRAIDIGIKGLSVQDSGFQLNVSEGDRFDNCKLTLPANPSLSVELEIVYMASIISKDGEAANRVGGKLINLNKNDEFALQRFINMIQIEQNALSKE